MITFLPASEIDIDDARILDWFAVPALFGQVLAADSVELGGQSFVPSDFTDRACLLLLQRVLVAPWSLQPVARAPGRASTAL